MIPSREFVEARLLPMLNSGDIGLVDKSIQQVLEIINTMLELSDEGELHLECLVPDNLAGAARLAKHPALLWKIHNVQQEKT